MGRRIGIAVAAVVLLVGAAAVYVFTRVTALDSEALTDDVTVLYGLGGNVGVLRTDRGAVIVDTMTFPLQGRRIRERAERLAGPTQVIINTHYHGDHTHGNPAWAVGTRVVSTELTRRYLEYFDSDFWRGDAAGTMPSDTFDDAHEMHIGGKTIRSYHTGRGHTGGDLVVLFVEDRVLHAGDLFFNGIYPNIDLEAGGSVQHWGDTLDRVLALDFDQVIPGHGPATDRAGLVAFQRFVRELAQVGADAARTGKSLEQTLASADLHADRGYEALSIPLVLNIDRDFVIRRAWEEASGAVQPVELPPSGAEAAP